MISRRRRIALLFGAFALLFFLPGMLSPVSSQAPEGAARPVDPTARGQAALDRLGSRLPAVAQAYGLSAAELRTMFLNDDTLAVDNGDELLYIDVVAPGEPAPTAPADGEQVAAAPPTTAAEFQLESLPGADKTIYLDFDGHVTTGTTWNAQYGVETIVTGPYNIDGNPDSWSATELQRIRDSWAVVAEDFAPWNVNVTTKEPPVDDLRRSGSGDTRWGARVVMTPTNWSNCGCGGHAYIGSFDDSVDEPTFVYNSGFRGMSEAITHEVGHMMNLAHDGTSSVTYYQGHQGSGEPSWAPIMGVAYYVQVGQWSQQEYTGANNNGSGANYGYGPDDVAIISSLTNGNGFGLKVDDHGDLSNPTPLNGGTPSIDGLISTRSDVDAFSFTTTGGQVALNAVGDAISPNLDIELTLRDGTGAVVATANPIGSLGAAINVTVPAGSYTVAIDGVGVGNPFAASPTGYTDYASLGQYTLSGTIDGVGPPDTTPPSPTTGLTGVEASGTVDLSWNPNTETDMASYLVKRSATSGGPYTTIATVPYGFNGYTDATPEAGDNHYVVVARDTSGNEAGPSNEVVVTITPSLDSVASGETPIHGTVSGDYTRTHALDGITQQIEETESGGKPSNRHDRAEHRWTVPASSGNQTLRVVATAVEGGDADDGFVFEWSTDGAMWFPVGSVSPAAALDATVSIGGPAGTIQVRVVDTDDTAGQTSFDTVRVDLIQVTGDGGPVDPDPDPTSLVAGLDVGTRGVGKGDQVGVATVTVVNDLGQPVVGASVTVTFGGTFAEMVSGTTDGSGVAVVETSSRAKKPTVTACVADVTDTVGSLPWMQGSEAC